MHRCFAGPDAWGADEVTLSAAESHHLRDVLRIAPGAEVRVFDGQGREARARVAGATADGRQRLALVEACAAPAARREIVLLQALPKGGRMDEIIEHTTALGVAVIAPVITGRTVAVPDDRRAAAKGERWARIAVSAAKQCRSATVPAVEPVRDFPAAVARAAACDLALLGAVTPDAQPLAAVLVERLAAARSVAILIGPEGDFTPAEIAAARAAAIVPVTFGERVLRTELAALYAVSVLQYLAGGLR